MNNIAFILTIISGFSTLVGSFIIFINKKKTINFLVGGISFAAGVMFFLSILNLLPESFIFFNTTYKKLPSILLSLTFLTLGICISIILDKKLPIKFNNSLYKLSLITTLGIILHNIPEGIATYITTNKNINLGISLTIAIAMHNIPEGISIALPIYYYTKKKSKAIFYSFICAISEPLGAIIAYIFLNPKNTTLAITYSIISGIMIYISMYELFPSSLQYKRYKISYLFYIFGLLFVLINTIIFN